MKNNQPKTDAVKKAIETVKALESETGVKISSGLRAGKGAESGGGGFAQPLYGAPLSSPD